MKGICNSTYRLKTAIITMIFAAMTITANAQGKYKRTYPLKNIDFKHAAAFASGNAIMFIDRDSLLNYLMFTVEYSDYYASSKEKINHIIDTIMILAKKSDITNISPLVTDAETTGIVLSYFSRCLLNKKANVFDKRKNEYVKKIIVKKSERSSRSFSAYAWYYYFLPGDRKEFMHRVEKIGTGIKFL